MQELTAEQPQEQAPDIPPEEFIATVVESDNLAPDLDDRFLAKTAQQVLDDYRSDKESMGDWFEAMSKGLELAQLVKEGEKSYPFQGAADIRYPLVTSAAMQFNARAYPAIVPSDQVVKAKVYGKDRDGAKAARGERIAEHMSWQLTSQIDEWEDDTDQLLLLLPIVGEMFRKVWFDGERPRTRLVQPGKLIVNDKVKSLSDAPRITEEIDLFPSEIKTRERTGDFVEIEYTEGDDKQAAQEFIEQHCRIDLDDDGYEEPYIVTVHVETQKVVRLVADFDANDVRYKTEQRPTMAPAAAPDGMGGVVQVMVPQMVEVPVGIISIRRNSYFVPYKMLPGLDGGFHGTGLGLLLGDISETINSIINMMLDAGHYAALGGGFIGGEMRMKGGAVRFKPGEWKMIATRGSDIRQSMVPMTMPKPDAVLFQMLGMLIDSGREIASVQEIMTGDSGGKSNMTATATLAIIDQGLSVFTAAYKRIFRSLKKEFKLLGAINARHVDPEEYNMFHDGEQQFDPAQDYGAVDMDIEPVADPRSVTRMQEAAKAQLIMQMASDGMLDPMAAAARIIEAANIGDVEELLPKPDPAQMQMQQEMEAMGLHAAKADLAQKMADIEKTVAEIEKLRAAAAESLVGVELDERRLRLDGLKTILEEQRKSIETAIGGRSAKLAGQPGNGSTQGGPGANAGGPAGADFASLLGGPAGAGGGTAGTA